MDDSLPTQPEEQRAIDLAFGAIGRRERTVAELRGYLERKRVEPDAIEAAVVELTKRGYLDDARYAERFAEDKRTLERWGSERIGRELTRRGVAPQHVDVAVSRQARDDELDAALELLRERQPVPHDERSRDRAWRLLVRRGYEHDLAYEAVRSYEREGAPRAA